MESDSDAGSADEGPWAPATYSPAHALASDGVWAASCSVAMVAPGAGAGNALLSTGEHPRDWKALPHEAAAEHLVNPDCKLPQRPPSIDKEGTRCGPQYFIEIPKVKRKSGMDKWRGTGGKHVAIIQPTIYGDVRRRYGVVELLHPSFAPNFPKYAYNEYCFMLPAAGEGVERMDDKRATFFYVALDADLTNKNSKRKVKPKAASATALHTRPPPCEPMVIKESLTVRAVGRGKSSGRAAKQAMLKLSSSAGHVGAFVDFRKGQEQAGSIESTAVGSSNGVTLVSSSGDFAEWHELLDPTAVLPEGTVVGFHGGRVSLSTAGVSMLGVVSERPIVVGSTPGGGGEAYTPGVHVAYCGRVPVRVMGPVREGDCLAPSGYSDGLARVVQDVHPALARTLADHCVSTASPCVGVGHNPAIDTSTLSTVIGVAMRADPRAHEVLVETTVIAPAMTKRVMQDWYLRGGVRGRSWRVTSQARCRYFVLLLLLLSTVGVLTSSWLGAGAEAAAGGTTALHLAAVSDSASAGQGRVEQRRQVFAVSVNSSMYAYTPTPRPTVCTDHTDSGLMGMPCTVVTAVQCAYPATKAMLATNCPMRCGLCTDSPTVVPTPAPTALPTTTARTAEPTTTAPTAVPTINPTVSAAPTAAPTECVDTADSGMMGMPCSVVSKVQCAMPQAKALLERNCPKTCNVCPTATTTTPTTTPTPTPTPTAACSDSAECPAAIQEAAATVSASQPDLMIACGLEPASTQCKKSCAHCPGAACADALFSGVTAAARDGGQRLSCRQALQLTVATCADSRFGPYLRWYCRKTCGTCGECLDYPASGFSNPMTQQQHSCASLAHTCHDPQFSALHVYCPNTCGGCANGTGNATFAVPAGAGVAAPATTGAGAGGWTKAPRKHCGKSRRSYSSLSAAKAACASVSNCSAVYDQGCDGKGSFYMCKANTVSASARGSCVYQLGVIANAPSTGPGPGISRPVSVPTATGHVTPAPSSATNMSGCSCAHVENQWGEGGECAEYSGYGGEGDVNWFNSVWCYASTRTCPDAHQHSDVDKPGYGASRAACRHGAGDETTWHKQADMFCSAIDVFATLSEATAACDDKNNDGLPTTTCQGVYAQAAFRQGSYMLCANTPKYSSVESDVYTRSGNGHYRKQANMRCIPINNFDGSDPDQATAACAANKACHGVYDQKCDGKDILRLCNSKPIHSSQGSCVFTASGNLAASATSTLVAPTSTPTTSTAPTSGGVPAGAGVACVDDASWRDVDHGGDGMGTCNDAQPQYSVAKHPDWCLGDEDYAKEARRACPVACGVCNGTPTNTSTVNTSNGSVPVTAAAVGVTYMYDQHLLGRHYEGTADLGPSGGGYSQTQCEAKCSNNPRCRSYVFRPSDGYCEVWSCGCDYSKQGQRCGCDGPTGRGQQATARHKLVLTPYDPRPTHLTFSVYFKAVPTSPTHGAGHCLPDDNADGDCSGDSSRHDYCTCPPGAEKVDYNMAGAGDSTCWTCDYASVRS